jgi:hypothetical protein
MQECQYCPLQFPDRGTLNQHIQAVHKEHCIKKHKCTFCEKQFNHTSSLRRHVKSEHTSNIKTEYLNSKRTLDKTNDCKMYPSYKKPKIVPPSTSKTTPLIVFAQYQELRNLLYKENMDDSFLLWSKRYQEHRGVNDPSISLSSTTNIISTHTNHFQKLKLQWNDPMQFCEQIDQWLDKRFEDTTLQPITTVNHVRHLKWWGMYKFTNSGTNSVILDWLTDIISSVQSASSKRANDAPCIAMLDPYQLSKLRDKIVMSLQKQQRDIIDPFMLKVCRSSSPVTYRKECIQFGIVHLRCFLDLIMRFLSPPQRMQCTIYQCEPDITDTQYVCKLSRRKNEYVRIVHRDKTGNNHQPLEVPIGITISTYLTFYRTYCRPDTSRGNTFQTSNGGYWVHASRDVKQYVKDHLNIDPNEIEPSGRFVHGSRHIGLATYALAVNFNSERLREFAHLIRHSVAVSEKYYSVWLERNRNERASKHYRETMGLKNENEEKQDEQKVIYHPLVLRPPSSLIRSSMLRKFNEELGKTMFIESPYQLCDASTQTGPENMKEIVSVNISDSCTLPMCKQCHEPFVVLGPLGQTRHKHFGQYFAHCKKCDGRRPNTSTTIWYPLGYIPSCPSISQAPRNMKHIQTYVSETI